MDKLDTYEKRNFDIAYRKRLLRGKGLSKYICVIHSFEIAENIFPDDLTSPEAIQIAKNIVKSLNNDLATFVFEAIVIKENIPLRHYYVEGEYLR